MTGYWATLALNIPDFTRFARTQRDQIVGQAVGLPGPMGLLATMSVIVTSATVLIYGKPVWDPVALSGNIGGIARAGGPAGHQPRHRVVQHRRQPGGTGLRLLGPVAQADQLPHRRLDHRRHRRADHAVEAAGEHPGLHLRLAVGYGALLGPVAGILIADYWLLRRARLDVEALYDRTGRYTYFKGWNLAAVAAFVIGVAPNLPGLPEGGRPAGGGGVGAPWTGLYDYAWFVGPAIAAAVYGVMMRGKA
jgi:NCS1 family nucleobase:cation symporter-1